MIYSYIQQSNKIDIGTWPSMDVSFDSYIATYSKNRNATDFQYQAFMISSLDKHDSHVATTVEVRKMSSQSTWHGLANGQPAHVLIEICDRICKRECYTRIRFCDFEEE